MTRFWLGGRLAWVGGSHVNYVSAMNLCTWFGTKSYRVIRCQRDGWNIEHTGIILSCVHGFRAVNCIGAPEYCNRKLVSLNSLDEE
jgi:hypothetical protein